MSAGTELPVRLLPVQVSSAPAASAGRSVEVVLASGTRVRFEPGTDVDYVARLVAALGRTAC